MQVRTRWVLAGLAAAAAVALGFPWLGLSPALSGPPVPSRANASIRPFGYDCSVGFMGNGTGAFVGGTGGNIAPGTDAFVGAGSGNIACDNNTAVAGGFSNNVTGNTSTQAEGAFIGGGNSNTISQAYSAIAGGQSNTASATDAFIGAGSNNTASGPDSVLGGGIGNLASGYLSTVIGGYHNLASGQTSFAGGFGSYAVHTGAFVWSDSAAGAAHLVSSAPNQFLVRATGGVKFFSNAGMTLGASLAPGSGTWGSASDRNLKRDVATLDDAAILAKVATLPITRWSYISEGGVRHIGPMAQDFYAAFGVGEDDRHITSIDEDGVALVAVKALHGENEALRARNAAQDRRIAKLEAAVRELLAAAKSR